MGDRLPLRQTHLTIVAPFYALLGAGVVWLRGSVAGQDLAGAAVTLSLTLFLGASVSTARRFTGDVRRAWSLIALGAALLLLGQLIRDAAMLAGTHLPVPSLYDAVTLAAVLAVIAGLLRLGPPGGLSRTLVALDLAGFACTLGILFATVFWGPFQASPLDTVARITILLHPILYGTLAAAIWFLPYRDTWPATSLRVLMVGLLAIVLASAIATPAALQHGFSNNPLLDLIWAGGAALGAASALTFQPVLTARSREHTMGATAWMTIASALFAMAVSYWHFRSLPLTPATVQAVGAPIMGLVMARSIRMGLTLNHSRDLVRQLRGATDALRESEALFRAVFERTPDGLFLLDPRSPDPLAAIVACNPAAAAMNGYMPEELLGWSINLLSRSESTHADELDYLQRLRREGVILGENLHYRKDGSAYPVEYSTSIVTLGGRELILGIDRDITERKQAEEALVHQALHDALTNLPNRTLLRDRLRQAILAAQRDHTPMALLFMDLNRFKDVNDAYGHHVGDALLTQAARRIQQAIRAVDTVARLGGDEFAVLLPATDRIGAAVVMQKIAAAFKEPLEVHGQVLDVGTSIGCALYPDHGDDAALLMRRADLAMYAAKRKVVVAAVYDPELEGNLPERLTLMRELRGALENGGLHLHFQPLLDLQTGDLEQVEALVRWQHPRHGWLLPGQFIPEAEESGVIKPLTEWVLDQALRQWAEWRRAGLSVGMAVNLSARTLHSDEIRVAIATLLDVGNVPPGSLILEITETAILVDPQGALHTLTLLHELGVQIAIDDFGTGYSSLTHLKRLPVDQIKIDRSFVTDMASDHQSASIVRSVLALGHSLGMRVVAEGVEDQATEDLLRTLGCDLIQGRHVGPPHPALLTGRALHAAHQRPSGLRLA